MFSEKLQLHDLDGLVLVGKIVNIIRRDTTACEIESDVGMIQRRGSHSFNYVL